MEINHAMAYTTIAMDRLGYTREDIERVTNEMLDKQKEMSIEEVEDVADQILFKK